MIFEEQDIDFLRLSPQQFEEMCFDLLLSLGYQELVWRQGGSDNGRDLEGFYSVDNPLIGTQKEKWFFECKRYEGGVPPEEISSKISWADAERPKYLVIIVSSYLTNGARVFLEKTISQGKFYLIHLIEGKQLKRLILTSPKLVEQYFLSRYAKLLVEAQNKWLNHNLIPERETIQFIISNIDLNKLSVHELAFIWCTGKIKSIGMDRANLDQNAINIYHSSLNLVFQMLISLSNVANSVISESSNISVVQLVVDSPCGMIILEMEDGSFQEVEKSADPPSFFNSWYYMAQLELDRHSNSGRALYLLARDDEGKGLEVLVEATDNLLAKVRFIERQDFVKIFDSVKPIILQAFKS